MSHQLYNRGVDWVVDNILNDVPWPKHLKESYARYLLDSTPVPGNRGEVPSDIRRLCVIELDVCGNFFTQRSNKRRSSV